MSRSRRPKCPKGRSCGVCSKPLRTPRSSIDVDAHDEYLEYLENVVGTPDGVTRLDYAYDVEVP